MLSITVQFSKSTLKPSVYTLSQCRMESTGIRRTRTVPVPGNREPNIRGTRTVPVPGSGEPNIPGKNGTVPVPKC